MAKQIYSQKNMEAAKQQLLYMKVFIKRYNALYTMLGITDFFLLLSFAIGAGSSISNLLNGRQDDSTLFNASFYTALAITANIVGIREFKTIKNRKQLLPYLDETISNIDELMNNVNKLTVEEIIRMNNSIDQSLNEAKKQLTKH